MTRTHTGVAMAACSIALVCLGVAGQSARAQPSPSEFARSWAEANQAYKAALQSTSEPRGKDPAKLLVTFQQRWQQFAARYSTSPPAPYTRDRLWQTCLAAVGQHARNAQAELQAGRVDGAHRALEEVRMCWLNTRTRNGVDAFGDRLTQYHEPMERVVLALKGKTPAALTATQISGLRAELPRLEAAWQQVMAPIQDDLPAAQAAERKALLAAEDEAVRAFAAAVGAGDREAILSSGSRLKPAFARLYMQFG